MKTIKYIIPFNFYFTYFFFSSFNFFCFSMFFYKDSNYIKTEKLWKDAAYPSHSTRTRKSVWQKPTAERVVAGVVEPTNTDSVRTALHQRSRADENGGERTQRQHSALGYWRTL